MTTIDTFIIEDYGTYEIEYNYISGFSGSYNEPPEMSEIEVIDVQTIDGIELTEESFDEDDLYLKLLHLVEDKMSEENEAYDSYSDILEDIEEDYDLSEDWELE